MQFLVLIGIFVFVSTFSHTRSVFVSSTRIISFHIHKTVQCVFRRKNEPFNINSFLGCESGFVIVFAVHLNHNVIVCFVKTIYVYTTKHATALTIGKIMATIDGETASKCIYGLYTVSIVIKLHIVLKQNAVSCLAP